LGAQSGNFCHGLSAMTVSLMVHTQWEVDTSQNFDPRLHDFPPADLLYGLVDTWFKTKHIMFPLLHQPTFMKNLADGLHYREGAFAGVLLMVCACASQYSTDPRVIFPGTDSWPSAGWQWFIQARTYHQVSLSSPCLHDVQMYCVRSSMPRLVRSAVLKLLQLGCAYLEGTSMPQACWTLCGTAIRLAQDVGAHRKKAYQSTPTVEDELWKRAFWLVFFSSCLRYLLICWTGALSSWIDGLAHSWAGPVPSRTKSKFFTAQINCMC
jgi:hypothetical protein